VRAGADPGEIVLRNQMTWKNNVNLAQTEVRGDGGPTAALRRLGRLRREHCCTLRLRDELLPERRQLEHAAAEPASRTTLYWQASACSSSRSCRAATSSCTRRASCVFMRFVPFTCVPLLTLCIHECTHTLSLSFFLSLSLSLSHDLSFSLFLSLSISLSLSHTLTHPPTHTHTHTHTHKSSSHHYGVKSAQRVCYQTLTTKEFWNAANHTRPARTHGTFSASVLSRGCQASRSKTTRYVRVMK